MKKKRMFDAIRVYVLLSGWLLIVAALREESGLLDASEVAEGHGAEMASQNFNSDGDVDRVASDR